MLVVRALNKVVLDGFYGDAVAMGTGGGFRAANAEEVLV